MDNIESSDILSQYQSLQQSGMFSSVENLKKENKELLRIIDDASELISLTNVDSMIDFIISKFLDYFIPENLVFIIKPPRRKHIRQYYYHKLVLSDDRISTEYFSHFKMYFDETINHEQSGNVYSFKELYQKLPGGVIDVPFMNLRPSFIIPLVAIGGTYGIVIVSDKITGNEFSEQEISYMTRIFSFLSVTIQNGLHYETSITDPKTGLYTNDFFFSRMKDTISSVRRYKTSGGMLIIDIDFFKKFNDTWGHLVGDKVLVAIANTLKKTVRTEDCVARFGGEEFSILLTQCTESSIYVVAERIRHAIEDIVMYEQGQQLKITVSVGGCVIESYEGLTPQHIFKKADQALYYSKEHGRNQSNVFRFGLLDLAKMRSESSPDSECEGEIENIES